MSNALGTINPVAEIVRIAHAEGAAVLLDGSQAAYHMPVDVRAIDCDFYVATGHKLYGPTGIGVLYGKASLLEELPPFMGGGDMIQLGHVRALDVERAAAQVRGRHARHRRRDRTWRCARLHHVDWSRARSTSTSRSC